MRHLATFAEDQGLFAPAFSFHNQQGRRFTQNAGVLVFDDGQAIYGERFTVQLQAPEFDFVQDPFDSQIFFVHVQAVFPREYMRFVAVEGPATSANHWARKNGCSGIRRRAPASLKA